MFQLSDVKEVVDSELGFSLTQTKVCEQKVRVIFSSYLESKHFFKYFSGKFNTIESYHQSKQPVYKYSSHKRSIIFQFSDCIEMIQFCFHFFTFSPIFLSPQEK